MDTLLRQPSNQQSCGCKHGLHAFDGTPNEHESWWGFGVACAPVAGSGIARMVRRRSDRTASTLPVVVSSSSILPKLKDAAKMTCSCAHVQAKRRPPAKKFPRAEQLDRQIYRRWMHLLRRLARLRTTHSQQVVQGYHMRVGAAGVIF